MKKIKKLPKHIEDRLPAIRDEWINIGLSTDPADREAAETGVDLAYRIAGLNPPSLKIWLDSPLEGAIAAHILSESGKVRQPVWDQVRHEVGEPVSDQVEQQVAYQVGDQVAYQVWNQVMHKVWYQVNQQVRQPVMDQVVYQVMNKVWYQVRQPVDHHVWDQVLDQVRHEVGAQVMHKVIHKVWYQVNQQVRQPVMDQVWEQVMQPVWDQVEEQVGDQVWQKVNQPVMDQVMTAIYGQHDAYWLSFYSTFRGLIDDVAQLDGLFIVAKTAGWWWPFEGAVILTDRPKTVRIDNALLHCETGPAIEYRDGFSVYAWHGVNVPAHWIEDKENLDPIEVLKTENVEQLAAGCQIIGWSKMLDHLDHKIIDSDPNPQHGDLIEVTIDGLPEPEWYLRFECPRNGLMMEGVNKRELSEPTVFAAQAWKSPLPDHLFSYPKTRS